MASVEEISAKLAGVVDDLEELAQQLASLGVEDRAAAAQDVKGEVEQIIARVQAIAG